MTPCVLCTKPGVAAIEPLSTSMHPSQTIAGDAPIVSEAEAERLAAVRRYAILDTPPEGAFDRVTRLAAQLFDVPIAIVSIIDHDRIWIKSAHGLEGVPEIPREPGLCSTAIEQNVPYILESAATDARSKNNSLVSGTFGLRFYVGIPLGTSDGYNLGTLCVLDREPQAADPLKVEMLGTLAKIVVDELELRLAAQRVAAQAAGRESARSTALEAKAVVSPFTSLTDPLTGLRNRNALERELEGIFDLYRRGSGHPGAIVLVEVEGLQRVNDVRGQDVGDRLLRSFALALVCTFPDHQIFRYTGDQFAVLSNSQVYDASLRQNVNRAVGSVHDDGFREAGASLGIAAFTEVFGSPSGALHLADSRLYSEKVARR